MKKGVPRLRSAIFELFSCAPDVFSESALFLEKEIFGEKILREMNHVSKKEALGDLIADDDAYM